MTNVAQQTFECGLKPFRRGRWEGRGVRRKFCEAPSSTLPTKSCRGSGGCLRYLMRWCVTPLCRLGLSLRGFLRGITLNDRANWMLQCHGPHPWDLCSPLPPSPPTLLLPTPPPPPPCFAPHNSGPPSIPTLRDPFFAPHPVSA